MKQILLALLLATVAATPCRQSPGQWYHLAVRFQDRAMLYVVRTGMIDTDRAIKLFEQLRDTVIRGKLEAEDTGRVEL